MLDLYPSVRFIDVTFSRATDNLTKVRNRIMIQSDVVRGDKRLVICDFRVYLKRELVISIPR